MKALLALLVLALVLIVAAPAGAKSHASKYTCPANPQGLDAASYFAQHPLPAGTSTATALKALGCFAPHTYFFGIDG